MPSFRSVVVALAALTLTSADQYTIDPDSVPIGTRDAWCASEIETCPSICQQYTNLPTLVNTCNSTTLSYGCLCGNNQQPNVSQYTLTLPYFICTEWGTQCVTGCGSDNTCASACRQNHTCGATDPKRAKKTTSKAGPSSTAAPVSTTTSFAADTIFTGTPGQSSDSSSSSSSSSSGSKSSAGRVALEAGRVYGLAIVGTGLFGLMMLL